MKLLSKSSCTVLVTFISLLFLLQACSDSPTRNRVTFDPPSPFEIEQKDTTYTTEDGLIVHVIESSDSPYQVVPRDQINAYYTGRIIENGEAGDVFDSTYRNEVSTPGILRNLTPTPITSSRGQQISPLVDGFRRGIVGDTTNGDIPPMIEGEKRTIIFPPSLGYGDTQEGSSGYNLRNDTLRFDIELETIQN